MTDETTFFFVHLMRTGGMTLLQHIRRNFAPEEIYPARDLDFPDGDLLEHLELSHVAELDPDRLAKIRVFTGHLPYMTIELLGLHPTTLTLLRDPVDRTISLLRVVQERDMPDVTLEEIYEDPIRFDAVIHNHQTKMFAMTPADRPRSFRSVIDIDEQRLQLAKANLDRIDLIGLSEQFGAFLDEAHRRFGWNLPDDLRLNGSRADRNVPKALRKRIAEDNAIDVAFYEYARELVSARGASMR